MMQEDEGQEPGTEADHLSECPEFPILRLKYIVPWFRLSPAVACEMRWCSIELDTAFDCVGERGSPNDPRERLTPVGRVRARARHLPTTFQAS